jgi:outer membrane protein assembly factor BamB
MLRKFLLLSLTILLFCPAGKIIYAQQTYDHQWPGFRGPWGRGYLEGSIMPEKWSIDSSLNIKWKTAIPGLAHSCPVIWNDYLVVTSAVNLKTEESLKVGLYGDIDEADDMQEHEFRVYCLDKNTGKIIWERVAHKGIPKSRRHTKSSQANCTPATDGHYLVALFGSEGLYCYDFQGNLLWSKDLGILNPGPYTDPGIEWGYASSPVIFNGTVIIQCDIPAGPFITAIDLATGNEKWRTSRGDEVSTWCTPAICSLNDKISVIANGYRHICGYDFRTGKEIWTMSGGGDAPAPTPVIANGYIYLNSAHGKFSPIFVINPDATGDITLAPDSIRSKFILWSVKRGGAYMQTPLVYGGYLYNLQTNGTLTCFDALNGEIKFKENLKEAFSSSGIAADGKLYFSSEEGNIYVIKAGPEFKLIAKNPMKDVCMATPAIAGNSIFFRTQHFVIAIEQTK